MRVSRPEKRTHADLGRTDSGPGQELVFFLSLINFVMKQLKMTLSENLLYLLAFPFRICFAMFHFYCCCVYLYGFNPCEPLCTLMRLEMQRFSHSIWTRGQPMELIDTDV